MVIAIKNPVVEQSLREMAEAQGKSMEAVLLAILASGLGLQDIVNSIFPTRRAEEAA